MKNSLFVLIALLILVSCKKEKKAESIEPTTIQPFFNYPVFTIHAQGNPIKTVNNDTVKGFDPFVMYDSDDEKYKMWYTKYSNQTLGTKYAESSDGLTWNMDVFATHVITPTPGTWDEDGIETVSVLKKDGIYHSWYLGYPGYIPSSENGRYKYIGYATSNDGINWTKHPSPVLLPTENWEQPYKDTVEDNGNIYIAWDGGVQEPAVIWDSKEQLYKMWYEAYTKEYRTYYNETSGEPYTAKIMNREIGYATSSDGITWEKSAANPVFKSLYKENNGPVANTWEYYNEVGHTSIFQDPNSGYHLFYFTKNSIGHAYSTDGISWTRNPGNPIIQGSGIPQGPNNPGQLVMYAGPTVFMKDSKLFLYFMRTVPNDTKWTSADKMFGFATSN